MGSTGIVLGIAAPGVATISYSVGLAGCTNTKVVTVNQSPAAISGTLMVCVGAATSLTDLTSGGTWTSTPSTIATVVSATGVVTGVTTGTAKITYTEAGCFAAAVVTVNPSPSGIGGSASICLGATITLSDNIAGGTWSSLADLTVVSSGTIASITGTSVGTTTVTYVLPTGCYKTYAETVKPLPTPILGTMVACGIGGVTFLSDATTGGTWTISPLLTATVTASGRVYGAAFGTATVTYTGTNTCIVTSVVTVNSLPVVSPITGASTVAHLSSITLSDITSGGLWSSTLPTIGSVGSLSGIVTGVSTSGTTTISYVITDGFGCKNSATKIVTVTATAPHPGTIVSGITTMITGETVSLADDNLSGLWSSSNTNVATVDETGNVKAISSGIANIVHVVSISDGDAATSVTPVVVNSISVDVRVVPNPNHGIFSVKGTLGAMTDENVTLEITDVLGQVVYTNKVAATGGKINELISLDSKLTNGMYMLNIKGSNINKAFHFVMEK